VFEFGCYALLAINVGLIWLGLQMGVRDGDGDRHIVSTHSALLFLFFFYVIFSASLSILFDNFVFTWVPAYSGAHNAFPILAIATLAFVLYLASYRLFSKSGPSSIFVQSEAPNKLFVMVALFLLITGIILKAYVYVKMGGLETSITRSSDGLADVYGMDSLDTSITTPQNLSGVAEVASCWLLVAALRRRRFVLLWTATFILVMSLAYLGSPKRSLLIEPIAAVMIAYSFYVRKLRTSLFPLLIAGIFLFGMGTLLFRSVLPASINGVYLDLEAVPWAHGSIIGFYVYSLEFSTFETMALAIYESDKLMNIFGGTYSAFYTTNIEPFLYIVPRALWSGKPTVFYDIAQGIFSLMIGSPLYPTIAGVSATFIGNSWAFGGILGLVAFSVLLGFVSGRNDVFLMRLNSRNKDMAIIVHAVILFLAFQLMRQGGSGYVFMIVVPNQVGFLLGIFLLSLTNWNNSGKMIRVEPGQLSRHSVGLR
jgi:hypothetical protein